MSNDRMTVSRNQREGRYMGHASSTTRWQIELPSGHVRAHGIRQGKWPLDSYSLWNHVVHREMRQNAAPRGCGMSVEEFAQAVHVLSGTPVEKILALFGR